MEMTGEQLIPSPQATVWAGLNDPEVLRSCIVGCQLLEPDGDAEYRLELLAAVGPVKARFKGRLVLSDIQPPTGYALHFEGSGGPAGFGKGSARVALAAQGDAATLLSYSVSASIGGKLAQVGSRLIDGIAKKMADDFFVKFTQRMDGYTGPAAVAAAVPAAEPTVAGTSAGPAEARAPAPATAAAPAAASPPAMLPPGVAAVEGMVPIVAWVPASQLARHGGPSVPAGRPPIHPLWWILGTAVFMVLLYLAFLRHG